MTGQQTIVDRAWTDHHADWDDCDVAPRTTFESGFQAGYRAALDQEPLRVQLDVDELARLGLVLLTPDEIDVVAPVLLEAGTRHLERGTAWHELGRLLHAIAERLYETTHRQESTRA